MRIHEIITEDISRRDFLKWMGAGAVAAGATAMGVTPGDAQAADWKSPKDFGYDKWEAEGKKLMARCQPIIKKLLAAAGPDGQVISKVTTSYAVVPGQAMAFGDGNVVFDPAIYYDLSDDTLAYVLGHEMGHIALNHKGYKGIPTKVTRQNELDADVYGGKLAFKAGYSPKRAFDDMSQAAKEAKVKAKDTHPDYKTRVKNLNQQLGVTDVATIQGLEHNAMAIQKFASAMA